MKTATTATTASQALEQVRAVAEEIRNDETATVGTVSRGDVVRQGDLYVVCITGYTQQLVLKATKRRQLAPGTSQGSRHVLKGTCRIFTVQSPRSLALAAIADALAPRKVDLHEELLGPLFETVGEVELDHPEHGNRLLPAGETFAVIYQRAFAQEEARVRRQQD